MTATLNQINRDDTLIQRRHKHVPLFWIRAPALPKMELMEH